MDTSDNTVVTLAPEKDQVMRRLTTLITAPPHPDLDVSQYPVPQAWSTCERLILPTWRPVSHLPTNHGLKYGPWNDGLTNDEDTIREIVSPSARSAALWWPNTLLKDVLGPMPPEKLPYSFEQRRMYAYTLYCAMMDFSTGFAERLPGVKNTQPNKLLKQTYSQEYIQAKCFDVVARLVELHFIGAFLPVNEDPTARGGHAAEERKLAFEDRFMELCISVTHFKNVATDLLSGNHVEVILYAPIQARQAKLDANCNNEFKRQLKAYKDVGGTKSQFSGLDGGAGSAIRPSQMDNPILNLPPPEWRSCQQLRPRPSRVPPLTQNEVNEMATAFLKVLLGRVDQQSASIGLAIAASRLSLPWADVWCNVQDSVAASTADMVGHWTGHVTTVHNQFDQTFAGAVQPLHASTCAYDSMPSTTNPNQTCITPVQPLASQVYYSDAHASSPDMARCHSSPELPHVKPSFGINPQHSFGVQYASMQHDHESPADDVTLMDTDSFVTRSCSTMVHSMPTVTTIQAQQAANMTQWQSFTEGTPFTSASSSMPLVSEALASPNARDLKRSAIDYDEFAESSAKRLKAWL